MYLGKRLSPTYSHLQPHRAAFKELPKRRYIFRHNLWRRSTSIARTYYFRRHVPFLRGFFQRTKSSFLPFLPVMLLMGGNPTASGRFEVDSPGLHFSWRIYYRYLVLVPSDILPFCKWLGPITPVFPFAPGRAVMHNGALY